MEKLFPLLQAEPNPSVFRPHPQMPDSKARRKSFPFSHYAKQKVMCCENSSYFNHTNNSISSFCGKKKTNKRTFSMHILSKIICK
jgi:hypothetical protein